MLENDRQTTPAACAHARSVRRVVTSEYFKREFLAEVDQCKDCGLQLWTRDTQQRFHTWMLKLKQEKRDLFQIQFYMPDPARQALKDVLKSFPGVPMSALIRGLTAVYLSAMVRYPEFQLLTTNLVERESYRKLMDGARKKTSIHFSPKALLDVQTWGQILKLTPNRLVEDAIFKSLALRAEKDEALRSFWDRNLVTQVELVLRSV